MPVPRSVCVPFYNVGFSSVATTGSATAGFAAAGFAAAGFGLFLDTGLLGIIRAVIFFPSIVQFCMPGQYDFEIP